MADVVLYSTDFNAADGGLPAGWTSAVGSGQILSNQYAVNSSPNVAIAPVSAPADFYVEMDAVVNQGGAGQSGFLARVNLGTGNGYRINWGTSQFFVRRVDANAETDLGAIMSAPTDGQRVRVEFTGAKISVFFDGVFQESRVDTSPHLGAGDVGIYSFGSVVRHDNFAVGTLGGLYAGLVSHWKLDEASGARLDSHGGNDLSENGTVGTDTGKLAALAAEFDGNTSNFLSRAYNETLQVEDESFTWAGWIWLNSTAGAPAVFSRNQTISDYLLKVEAGSNRWSWAPGFGNTANFTPGPSSGAWYFFVVWFDIPNDVTGISINNASAVTATIVNDVDAQTDPLHVGKYPDGALSARLCELSFWKRALTSDDRDQLWNGGAGLPYADFGTSPVVPVLTQSAYRFKNDDGDEDGATAAGAENTPIVRASGVPFRTRIQIDQVGAGADNALELRYQKQGSATGVWHKVN